jgi:peptide/nickel transport system substrate-binding protein
MNSYWEQFSRSRLSRRKALKGAAALGAGAAALSLVGCGGGGSSGSSGAAKGPVDKSGLLGQAVDTTAKATRGGTIPSITTTDVTSFDPLTSQSFTTATVAGYVYSRILKVVPGHLSPSKRDVEGDLAESWEVSPDKLQVTFKLRQNAKWDQRAPTSGRAVTAEDVIYSWDRFSNLSPFRADLANSPSSPTAPIRSITAPDNKTIVVTLTQPDAAVLALLSSTTDLWIMPKETEGGFDPKKEMRGSSAWFLEKYTPSAGFTVARNPNWYRNDLPLADRVDYPIVGEYAAGLAQFRAGNTLNFGVQDTDVLQTKKDIPELTMLQGNFNNLWYNSWFGYNGNSPFKDERVRQAVSMSYDRDLWIDTINNTKQYSDVGLPIQKRIHSHLSSGLDGWWVDPRDEKAFGANSKYFQFNLAEAKKLLSAAGYSGNDVIMHHINTSQYGRTFVDQVNIQIGFMNDLGIKSKIDNPDYQTDWLNKYYYGKGNFEGMALGADNTDADIGAFLYARFHPQGARFKGFDPNGLDPKAGDPALTKLMENIRTEFDTEKRKEIAKQIQQYLAKAMYTVPFPGQAAGFNLVWPALGNAGVYFFGSNYGYGTETVIYQWLDKTKPPYAKS